MTVTWLYRSCARPLPRLVASVHNARPARPVGDKTGDAGEAAGSFHRVLTFFETALICAAPQRERPDGREREGRRKSPPHEVLTDAKVALQCAAHPGGNGGVLEGGAEATSEDL